MGPTSYTRASLSARMVPDSGPDNPARYDVRVMCVSFDHKREITSVEATYDMVTVVS